LREERKVTPQLRKEKRVDFEKVPCGPMRKRRMQAEKRRNTTTTSGGKGEKSAITKYGKPVLFRIAEKKAPPNGTEKAEPRASGTEKENTLIFGKKNPAT